MNNEKLIINNAKPVGTPLVGILERLDTTVPEKRNNVAQRGITLIALIITIIVMIILAGVVLSLTIGERGIFKTAVESAEKMEEAEAREKLELVLLDLQADKVIDMNYNEKEYINTKIQANEMTVNGDIVFVNGWQFQIDRSVPEIGESLGKGQPEEQIQIGMTSTTSSDYVKATIKIEIAYEKEIVSILLNGENIEIPEKQEGKYVIEKEVANNGTYSVIAKDAEDKYNIKSIKISDITEDMDIYTAEDLVRFRDMVNSGRTYAGRTVRLMNDLDLSSVCGESIGSWKPIGTETNPFKGTFLGKGNTINSIYINTTEEEQGLFGFASNGKIADVEIHGTIYASNYSGVICAKCENEIIQNCINYVDFSNNSTDAFGGILGIQRNEESSSKILNCINYGKIEGHQNVGGIIGVKDLGTIEINECANFGEINATYQSGGIIGGSLGGETTINNCYNTGKITGQKNRGNSRNSIFVERSGNDKCF